ncbi:hypothetical protein [Pseudomonas sp. O230]|uniref:hypothetical protein n=1 Tax=Pseudomonas sp. O230 TaxID=3159450 RepID=UPI00387B2EFE
MVESWRPHLKALADPAVKDECKLVEWLTAVPPGEKRDTLGNILVERLAKDPAARLRLSNQVTHGPGHSHDIVMITVFRSDRIK